MDEASSSALIDKLVRLGADLKRAGEFFDPNAPDGGRLGSFLAIGSVTEFLSSIGGTDPAMLVPLRRLQYALADLDRGKVVPLLARKKAAHRPPDSHAKEAFRAAVAGAMDVMVVAKINNREAARVVAMELSSLGYQEPPGTRITGAMVEDWRERMMTESPAKCPAVDRFRRFRCHFQNHPPTDPRAQAMSLLRNLTLVAPPGNLKNPPS